jgi:hypothetical protein
MDDPIEILRRAERVVLYDWRIGTCRTRSR